MDSAFKRNNFDLLRLFAASQVMLLHAFGHLNVPLPSYLSVLDAFPGVPIFFAISGFLISASYENSADLRKYARNRALRIFPALWCCIIATVLAFSLLGANFLSLSGLTWLFAQFAGAIYTPVFLKNFGFGSYNGSLWTIPIELQFYILLPLLYCYTPAAQRRTRYIAFLWIAFLGIAILGSRLIPFTLDLTTEPLRTKLFRYSFLPHFYLFLTGVLLQRLRVYQWQVLRNKGVYWLVAYLALFYVLPRESGIVSIFMRLMLALVAVSMAYTGASIGHWLLRGNDISYGIYIYHGLFVNVFIEAGLVGRPRYALALAVCTYLAGYCSWLIVERRFLRRKGSINASASNQQAAHERV
jgi:peptidoglycan/LPS O-acetylase OafA/YrhL